MLRDTGMLSSREDEDGVAHQADAQTRNTTSTATGVISGANHAPSDDDLEGGSDEDPPIPPDSFFDVYYDPDFFGEPSPTFLQHFGGDDPLSATFSPIICAVLFVKNPSEFSQYTAPTRPESRSSPPRCCEGQPFTSTTFIRRPAAARSTFRSRKA